MSLFKASFLNKAKAPAASPPGAAESTKENKARLRVLHERARALYESMCTDIKINMAKEQQPTYDEYEEKLDAIRAQRAAATAKFAEKAERLKEEARLGMVTCLEQYDSMLERGESLPEPDTVFPAATEQERKRAGARDRKRKQRENFDDHVAATEAKRKASDELKALQHRVYVSKRHRPAAPSPPRPARPLHIITHAAALADPGADPAAYHAAKVAQAAEHAAATATTPRLTDAERAARRRERGEVLTPQVDDDGGMDESKDERPPTPPTQPPPSTQELIAGIADGVSAMTTGTAPPTSSSSSSSSSSSTTAPAAPPGGRTRKKLLPVEPTIGPQPRPTAP